VTRRETHYIRLFQFVFY